VWTCSGRIAPSSTTCAVCTIVVVRRHRHDRIEIPRAVAVGQIAEPVRLPGIDQPTSPKMGIPAGKAGRCHSCFSPFARTVSAAVGVKKACPPAPAARMRSASVPADDLQSSCRRRTDGPRRCRREQSCRSAYGHGGSQQIGDWPVVAPPAFMTRVRSRRARLGETCHQGHRHSRPNPATSTVAPSRIPSSAWSGGGRIYRSWGSLGQAQDATGAGLAEGRQGTRILEW